MKVALCFAGFIEELDDTREFWSNLISKYNIDVYASFWEKDKNELNKFINMYNPKKLEVEEYLPFEITTQQLAASKIKTPLPPNSLMEYLDVRAREFRAFPMWYKVWRSNLLSASESYDVVIRARTDIRLDNNFELVQNNMLNIPAGETSVGFWPDSTGINDLFAFGPQNIMNYYSFIYHHLMDYLNQGHYAFPPEHVLAVHMSKTNIPIRFIPSLISISRKSKGQEEEIYNSFVGVPQEKIIQSNTFNFPINPNITFKA